MTPAARDRAMPWLVFAMALVVAAYPSFLSRPVTLLAPMCLLPVLILLDGDGSFRPFWLVFTLALLGWSLVSHSIMGGSFPRLVHTISMYAPFGALAFGIRRPEWLSLRFAALTVALIEVRIVVAYVAAGAEWRPWQVEDGNILVAKLNVLLPLVFLSYLKAHERGDSGVPYVALLSGGVLCAFLVLARAGFGILAMIVFIALLRLNWKGLFGLGAIAVAAWRIAPEVMLAFLKKARVIDFRPVSPRRMIWTEAFEAVRGSPWFGVGPGNSERALQKSQCYHAHNSVVQATLENGWPGGLPILGLTLYLAALAARLLWQGGRSTYWGLSLLAYIVFSMVSAPIQLSEFTLAVVLVVMAVRDPERVAG